MSSNCVAVSDAFSDEKLDPEGIFECSSFRDLNGHFLIAMRKDGVVIGAIGTSYTQMMLLDSEDDEIEVMLLRIFNLIYDKYPNASKLIDQYLSLSRSRYTDQ